MLYHAREESVCLDGTDMHFARFGTGSKPLVIIIGLLDGLKTVQGHALILAGFYRIFGKAFDVCVFARKDNLQPGYSIHDMARDQKLAMDKLGITSAHVVGISQGGMIAQWLAIDYPEAVKKLVIGVSLSRPNPTVTEVLRKWVEIAEREDYSALMDDNMRKTYIGKRYRVFKRLIPLLKLIEGDGSFERFRIQAQACMAHDAYGQLDRIKAPTLILGGKKDRITGPDSSEEMAKRIPNSRIFMYRDLGHGAYMETRDFNRRILAFLKRRSDGRKGK
ncbi:MAG: alpha/beta hydrolase [Clostridia bacterium]